MLDMAAIIRSSSPYRVITRLVLHHIRELRAYAPRDIIAVYIPQFVVCRWWEQFLYTGSHCGPSCVCSSNPA